MEWKSIEDKLPNHNDLVIIIHRTLNVCVCIYKELEKTSIFVPIKEMRFLSEKYFESNDWYSIEECFDKSYIDSWIQFPSNQPERSKREDSQKCEMRCSEHCGNTVRDK